MTLTGLIGIINTISSLGLATFVFLKRPSNRINQSYLFFGLSVALYSVGYFFWGQSNSVDDAVFAFKILTTGIIVINSSYLEFIFSLLGTIKKKRFILLFIHILNIGFIYATLSNNLFSTVIQKNVWGYWPVTSYLFRIYFVAWLAQFLYGLFHLYLGYKNTFGQRSNQIKYVFISTFVGYLGGATNWLPWFDITIFPPHLNILVTAYIAILAYAIVRHRLMDIDVIIKKTLIFAGLSSLVIGLFSIPLFVLSKIFAESITGTMQVWIVIISGMIVAALVRPVNQLLENVTDRYLFQKRQEIKVILKDLSEKVITVLDLKQLGKMLLSALANAFRLESGIFFIHDNQANRFRLLEFFGVDQREFSAIVRDYIENPEIEEFFKKCSSAIVVEQINLSRIPVPIKNWLSTSKAHVCMPLLIDEHQIGILVLGKKKSDQEFTRDEIDFFPTIESQVSLAIRNARLIETIVEEREAKVKAEHLAQRVSFAGLIKHEIKNKLVHIEAPANEVSTYFIPSVKRIFKEQDEEWFLEMCEKIDQDMKKINAAVRKILIIAQTASGGVDENDKAFQELNFKVIWEDAKRESGILEKCDFESKMPDGFSIYGNYHALQRVFVNLMTNAYDAMKNMGNPVVKLRCCYEEIEGRNSAYFEFEDSGPGIAPEILPKIFDAKFSTKPKPDAKDLISSGHGEGLAACKMYIENVHKGKIWAESEPGRGAIFKFWIPMPDSK